MSRHPRHRSSKGVDSTDNSVSMKNGNDNDIQLKDNRDTSTDNIAQEALNIHQNDYQNIGIDHNSARGDSDGVNGIGRKQLNSDSSYSIDVLSGGESEYDSIRKRKLDQNDTLDRIIKSPIRNNGVQTGTDTFKHGRQYPVDKIFYIAKELLMTERTYKKDLEVITNWFREEVPLSLEKECCGEALWEPLEALCAYQIDFLRALETHFGVRSPQLDKNGMNENGVKNYPFELDSNVSSIGQLMLKFLAETLPCYDLWIENHLYSLKKFEYACNENPSLERLCREMEVHQKACYLPLYIFALKPLYRLLHYRLILTRALELYSNADEEYNYINESLSLLQKLCDKVEDALPECLNYCYLCLLRRDVDGLDNLHVPGRRFLRQGCLFKYTNKGPQQRMFFLFSDILVYCNKVSNSHYQFKVHGIIPVYNIQVELAEYTNSFSVYGEGRAMTLSANTSTERDLWVTELERAAKAAVDETVPQMPRNMAISNSSEELSENNDSSNSGLQRSNTLAHVCWHRNISLSYNHLAIAMKNQLSGYLLRKFKNSQGWQRLWVVFASFCLYFYKTYHDDFPLASLPLLGYNITTANEKDGINKDFVMKLVFKNHVYFFRAESDYTFRRWMEVIGSATMQQIPIIHNM